MKTILMIVSLTIISAFAQADQLKKAEVYCKALLVENGVKEEHLFTFSCGKYGEGTSFQSQSGRFFVSAFSEESCTPALIIHDATTKTHTSAAGISKTNGFAVFQDKLVAASMIADISRENVLGPNPQQKNGAILGCSTDQSLLEEIE